MNRRTCLDRAASAPTTRSPTLIGVETALPVWKQIPSRSSRLSWEPTSSILSVEFLVYSETDFEEIAKFQGIAEYITDVGLHYAADNCRTIEPPDITDAAGGLAITIEGDPAFQV